MEKLFVTKLEIKKVRHLKDITINLSDTTSRHLILCYLILLLPMLLSLLDLQDI